MVKKIAIYTIILHIHLIIVTAPSFSISTQKDLHPDTTVLIPQEDIENIIRQAIRYSQRLTKGHVGTYQIKKRIERCAPGLYTMEHLTWVENSSFGKNILIVPTIKEICSTLTSTDVEKISTLSCFVKADQVPLIIESINKLPVEWSFKIHFIPGFGTDIQSIQRISQKNLFSIETHLKVKSCIGKKFIPEITNTIISFINPTDHPVYTSKKTCIIQ